MAFVIKLAHDLVGQSVGCRFEPCESSQVQVPFFFVTFISTIYYMSSLYQLDHQTIGPIDRSVSSHETLGTLNKFLQLPNMTYRAGVSQGTLFLVAGFTLLG